VDLEVATRDELVDELARRFTHVLVLTDTETEAGVWELKESRRGGFSAAVGMVERYRRHLRDEMTESEEEE
jgi:hypothetical protein